MDEPRRRRARFRAWRRGWRETDLILGPFADARVAGMSEAELSAFESLLDASDGQVWAWITEAQAPPAELDGPVMAALRARVRAGPAARGG
jgi:antitoxin CptB